MTESQVKQLMEAERRAQHEPWKAIPQQAWCVNHVVYTHSKHDDINNPSEQFDLFEMPTFETCEFVALARNHLKALCESWMEQRARIEELEATNKKFSADIKEYLDMLIKRSECIDKVERAIKELRGAK